MPATLRRSYNYFLVKAIVCPVKFHQTFVKNHFLILAIFFPATATSLKAYKKIPGKNNAEMYEEPSQISKIELFLEIVNEFSCGLFLQEAQS